MHGLSATICLQCQTRFRMEDVDRLTRSALWGAQNRRLFAGPTTRTIPRVRRQRSRAAGRRATDDRSRTLPRPGLAVSPCDRVRETQHHSSRTSAGRAHPWPRRRSPAARALLLERAHGRLWSEDVREILQSTADGASGGAADRLGAGYLNIARALKLGARVADRRRKRHRISWSLAVAAATRRRML